MTLLALCGSQFWQTSFLRLHKSLAETYGTDCFRTTKHRFPILPTQGPMTVGIYRLLQVSQETSLVPIAVLWGCCSPEALFRSTAHWLFPMAWAVIAQ